jgi:ornithine carbamoyltransferase
VSKSPRNGKTPPRHFLDIDRIAGPDLRQMLDMGAAYKRERRAGGKPLAGKTLAMIFEKPSTRTRVSFEVAMRQLGGEVVILNAGDMQLGRGETIADTARVLSRYVDAIMIRTTQASKLEDLAKHATVPVINGLTDQSHPCQLMADIMTLEERKGPAAGKIVAWSGDERLMSFAKPDAIFMHCLPAKRGDEVTAEVIDGPRSVVWDEAENRLHAQKGILAWCLA